MVLPEFLSYLISMPMYQKHILSKNSGATRQAFNFEEIRKFRVMLPPLGEQKRFTILFNKIELLKTRQIDSEEELKNLFNSLMEKAFN
jgi:type I restriction enzyme S subunit